MNLRIVLPVVAAAGLAAALGVGCGDQSGKDLIGLGQGGGNPDGGIVPAIPVPPGTNSVPPSVTNRNFDGRTFPNHGPVPPPPAGVTRWTNGDGISTWVNRVSVDEGHNVYAINDDTLYSMRAGTTHWTSTTAGGQFALNYPLLTVCGGEAGQAFLGWSAPETDPMTEPESQRAEGDVDRFVMQGDGSMAFAHHYELQNSAVKFMDDTRIILSCKYIRHGIGAGEMIVGSNHGFDVLHGDDYVDHRHVVWSEPNGSLAVGYVWAVNADDQGTIYEAGHWMLGALASPPATDINLMIDYNASVWIRNTFVRPWGAIEDPDDLDAIVGDVNQGWVLVGSMTKGMAINHYGPKQDDWTVVTNAPDSYITSLEMDTDGKILVGTGSRGLWKLDRATMTFTQSTSLPDWVRVRSIAVDPTETPRTVWVATDQGLYSLSGVD